MLIYAYIASIIFFKFTSKGFASSICAAQMEAERQATPQRCFLLGAMDKAQPLDVNDQRKISETVSVSVNDVAEAALVSKKCFMADIGFEGTVFSSGDTLIITAHRQEFVMKVDTFLSVRVSGSCRLLGKGCCYAFSLTNDGQPTRFLEWICKGTEQTTHRSSFFPG